MKVIETTFCLVLVVSCYSLAHSVDLHAFEKSSSDGLAEENEARGAQPNDPADPNTLVDDLLNTLEFPNEETDLDGQEGEPGEYDELEEEHEYFDHIDSNQGLSAHNFVYRSNPPI